MLCSSIHTTIYRDLVEDKDNEALKPLERGDDADTVPLSEFSSSTTSSLESSPITSKSETSKSSKEVSYPQTPTSSSKKKKKKEDRNSTASLSTDASPFWTQEDQFWASLTSPTPSTKSPTEGSSSKSSTNAKRSSKSIKDKLNQTSDEKSLSSSSKKKKEKDLKEVSKTAGEWFHTEGALDSLKVPLLGDTTISSPMRRQKQRSRLEDSLQKPRSLKSAMRASSPPRRRYTMADIPSDNRPSKKQEQETLIESNGFWSLHGASPSLLELAMESRVLSMELDLLDMDSDEEPEQADVLEFQSLENFSANSFSKKFFESKAYRNNMSSGLEELLDLDVLEAPKAKTRSHAMAKSKSMGNIMTSSSSKSKSKSSSSSLLEKKSLDVEKASSKQPRRSSKCLSTRGQSMREMSLRDLDLNLEGTTPKASRSEAMTKSKSMGNIMTSSTSKSKSKSSSSSLREEKSLDVEKSPSKPPRRSSISWGMPGQSIRQLSLRDLDLSLEGTKPKTTSRSEAMTKSKSMGNIMTSSTSKSKSKSSSSPLLEEKSLDVEKAPSKPPRRSSISWDKPPQSMREMSLRDLDLSLEGTKPKTSRSEAMTKSKSMGNVMTSSTSRSKSKSPSRSSTKSPTEGSSSKSSTNAKRSSKSIKDKLNQTSDEKSLSSSSKKKKEKDLKEVSKTAGEWFHTEGALDSLKVPLLGDTTISSPMRRQKQRSRLEDSLQKPRSLKSAMRASSPPRRRYTMADIPSDNRPSKKQEQENCPSELWT